MASQAQVDVATALANSIKTEELGKNEARLMAYASAVLKGLKEINFQAIATLTAQLMKDHAIAQIVGWPAVEAMREKKELLALGLSTEEADELSSMKLKAKGQRSSTYPRHSFRAQAPRKEEGPKTNSQSSKTQGAGPSKKK